MFRIIEMGGPLMYPILLCSILFIAILIERLYHLHRARIDTKEFISGIRNILRKREIAEAISVCDSTPGPVAHIVKAGIRKHDHRKDEIKETIEDAALHEVPRLEKNLNVLATVAHIAPLLGLLGTVLGMIGAFQEIQRESGRVNAADLAGGIWEALITTAAGLSVAIPAYVAYNYLVSRVGALVLDMEKSATEVVDLLTSKGFGSFSKRTLCQSPPALKRGSTRFRTKRRDAASTRKGAEIPAPESSFQKRSKKDEI